MRHVLFKAELYFMGTALISIPSIQLIIVLLRTGNYVNLRFYYEKQFSVVIEVKPASRAGF